MTSEVHKPALTREQVLEATLTNPLDYYLGAALDDLLTYSPGEGPARLKRVIGFLTRLRDIESERIGQASEATK